MHLFRITEIKLKLYWEWLWNNLFWRKKYTENYIYLVFTNIDLYNQILMYSMLHDSHGQPIKGFYLALSFYLAFSFSQDMNLWSSELPSKSPAAMPPCQRDYEGRIHRDRVRCPRSPSCGAVSHIEAYNNHIFFQSRYYLRWDNCTEGYRIHWFIIYFCQFIWLKYIQKWSEIHLWKTWSVR